MAKTSVKCALLALLATSACGGDDSGNESGQNHDAGHAGGDSGVAATVRDAGNLDGATATGALDAGAHLDATSADSADASAELAQALVTDGVQVSLQRADLVIAALCQHAASYTPGAVDQKQCIQASKVDWSQPMIFTDSSHFACVDATLDLTACNATAPCNQPNACRSFATTEAMLCSGRDAGR